MRMLAHQMQMEGLWAERSYAADSSAVVDNHFTVLAL